MPFLGGVLGESKVLYPSTLRNIPLQTLSIFSHHFDYERSRPLEIGPHTVLYSVDSVGCVMHLVHHGTKHPSKQALEKLSELLWCEGRRISPVCIVESRAGQERFDIHAILVPSCNMACCQTTTSVAIFKFNRCVCTAELLGGDLTAESAVRSPPKSLPLLNNGRHSAKARKMVCIAALNCQDISES